MNEDFEVRFRPYADRYQLRPASYEIRGVDGLSGGWVAQVQVVRDSASSMKIQTLTDSQAVPPNPRVFSSKDEADVFALQFGLAWLEEEG